MKPTRDEILAELARLKRKWREEGIEELALFGSFARETATPYSDIDIALKKAPDFVERYGPYGYFELAAKLREELGRVLHRRVDLLDLDAPSPVKPHIENELIYV